MLTSPKSETSSQRFPFGWLRVVRTAALCSLPAILVPWYVAIFRDLSRQDNYDLLWPLVFCPLWLPYVWIFWGLRPKVSSDTIKKTLAVALGCGSLILILLSFVVGVTSFELERQAVFVYALVALLQVALLFGSIRAYYSMGREPGDLLILAKCLWVPVAGIAVVAIILPNLFFLQNRVPYEALSVSSLRTINTAQVEYARTHPDRGFASSLAELGPRSSGLIDSVLASGKKSDYLFTLAVPPPDSQGRTIQYTVQARPIHYGRNTQRSFFTDESGILRSTSENRPATTQDPPL